LPVTNVLVDTYMLTDVHTYTVQASQRTGGVWSKTNYKHVWDTHF